MKPSLVKLQKFFKLEAERGYDNRAVMGGLSRMLEPWEAEARLDGLPDELISAVLSRLRDYNRLSPASREEALQGLWRRIQVESETQPAQEASPEDIQPPPEEVVEAIIAKEQRNGDRSSTKMTQAPMNFIPAVAMGAIGAVKGIKKLFG